MIYRGGRLFMNDKLKQSGVLLIACAVQPADGPGHPCFSAKGRVIE